MRACELENYEQALLELRGRLIGDRRDLMESIQEDGKSSSNLPLHPADSASTDLDANVQMLASEQEMLGEIETALASLREGSFGRCKHCGLPIAAERLQAIPFTPVCIDCARNGQSRQPAGNAARAPADWAPPHDVAAPEQLTVNRRARRVPKKPR